MYYSVRGVPQDHAEAAKWFRKAADQGDVDTQFNLGAMYVNGEGVPQDHAEAVKWFRKAADQGDADAQFNLGVAYGNADGVPQDDVQALLWFTLAGAQGNADAIRYRNEAIAKMTPAQVAEAERLAREWKPTNQQTPARP